MKQDEARGRSTRTSLIFRLFLWVFGEKNLICAARCPCHGMSLSVSAQTPCCALFLYEHFCIWIKAMCLRSTPPKGPNIRNNRGYFWVLLVALCIFLKTNMFFHQPIFFLAKLITHQRSAMGTGRFGAFEAGLVELYQSHWAQEVGPSEQRMFCTDTTSPGEEREVWWIGRGVSGGGGRCSVWCHVYIIYIYIFF